MSSPFDSPRQVNIENEARKTVDTSWDSPFHTLGKGATQAAAGNHGHPENLTPDELIAGSNITLNKNSDGTVTIHGSDPGAPISDHGALSNRLTVDQHNIASITGLQAALEGKAATTHTHSSYALSGHNHSGVYSGVGHAHDYAATVHSHDYAATVHSHDYAASSHSHNYAATSHTHTPKQSGVGYGTLSGCSLAGDEKNSWNVPHNLGRKPSAVTAVATYDGGVMSIAVSVSSWDASNVLVNARNLNPNSGENFSLHVIVAD